MLLLHGAGTRIPGHRRALNPIFVSDFVINRDKCQRAAVAAAEPASACNSRDVLMAFIRHYLWRFLYSVTDVDKTCFVHFSDVSRSLTVFL